MTFSIEVEPFVATMPESAAGVGSGVGEAATLGGVEGAGSSFAEHAAKTVKHMMAARASVKILFILFLLLFAFLYLLGYVRLTVPIVTILIFCL
jgi:hypothetical protein